MSSNGPASFQRPVHFGRGLRQLTPRSLEDAIPLAELVDPATTGWSARARAAGILFDLSLVEWVDIGAVVQLVLLAHAAVRSDIPVTVAFPLASPTAREIHTAASERVTAGLNDKALKARSAAKRFL